MLCLLTLERKGREGDRDRLMRDISIDWLPSIHTLVCPDPGSNSRPQLVGAVQETTLQSTEPPGQGTQLTFILVCLRSLLRLGIYSIKYLKLLIVTLIYNIKIYIFYRQLSKDILNIPILQKCLEFYFRQSFLFIF